MGLVILVEIVTLYIFVNIINCMVIVLLVISFLAIFYIDGVYILLVMIVWPIILYLYLIISSVVNGINLGLVLKIMYVIIISVLVGGLMILYVLSLTIMSVAILYVLSSYISYWILNTSLLVLSVVFYIMSDVNVVWLGVLPLTFMFIKQFLVILLFMMKVIWWW